MQLKGAWKLTHTEFDILCKFCGGIESMFPKTSRLEADFSLIRRKNTPPALVFDGFISWGNLPCKSSLSLLTWTPCINSMLNIGGWNSLPGAEARCALGTVPIGLSAILCIIGHISVWLSVVLLVISVSLTPSLPPPFPIILSLSLYLRLLCPRLSPHLHCYMPHSYP